MKLFSMQREKKATVKCVCFVRYVWRMCRAIVNQSPKNTRIVYEMPCNYGCSIAEWLKKWSICRSIEWWIIAAWMKYYIIWIYRAYFRIINVLGPFLLSFTLERCSYFYASFVFRLIYHLSVCVCYIDQVKHRQHRWKVAEPGNKAIYLEQLCINQTKCDWTACKLRIINHLWLWHQVCDIQFELLQMWYSGGVIGCATLSRCENMNTFAYSQLILNSSVGYLRRIFNMKQPNSDNQQRRKMHKPRFFNAIWQSMAFGTQMRN